MILDRLAYLSVVLLLVLGARVVEVYGQESSTDTGVPSVIQDFLDAIPHDLTAGEFRELADEHVWNLYANPSVSREELERYMKSGGEEAGLAFTAIALIQYHSPTSVRAILTRVLDESVAKSSRWYMLNAAPYALSIGDMWYPGDGALGPREEEYAKGLREIAKDAEISGIGNMHARRLLTLYEAENVEAADKSDLALARWHFSAYLLGTLDLRDHSLLDDLVSPDGGVVTMNLITALSYATNQDFVGPFQDDSEGHESVEAKKKLIKQAKSWWADYLKKHPNGDWKPAVVDGFDKAGYKVSFEVNSPETRRELMRALGSKRAIYRYNACKVLNALYGTRFDIERIYLGKKYALGPFDPTGRMDAYQKRLERFWRDRLNDEDSA